MLCWVHPLLCEDGLRSRISTPVHVGLTPLASVVCQWAPMHGLLSRQSQQRIRGSFACPLLPSDLHGSHLLQLRWQSFVRWASYYLLIVVNAGAHFALVLQQLWPTSGCALVMDHQRWLAPVYHFARGRRACLPQRPLLFHQAFKEHTLTLYVDRCPRSQQYCIQCILIVHSIDNTTFLLPQTRRVYPRLDLVNINDF